MSDKIWLDHIGIAVSDLESGSKFWRILGLSASEDELNIEQGVKIRFFSTDVSESSPKIELLEPTGDDTPVGKFIASRGHGVQQVAFRVNNLDELLNKLDSEGIRIIGEPSVGAGGSRIVFVHPKSTGGILVELLEK